MGLITISKEQHIAVVTLNRPDKLNALNLEMLESIIGASIDIQTDKNIRCVVIQGNGKAFCAGLDLESFSPGSPMLDQPLEERTHGLTNIWQEAVWCWRRLDIPVVAAIHGTAFGGGLQLMLGADIKYVHPDTKLSILEGKWGIIPDMCGSYLMRLSVRDDIIRELTYTHRVFSGEEAVNFGFATHLSNDPHTDAKSLAETIALQNPSSVVQAKQLLNKSQDLDLASTLQLESTLQSKIIRSENQFESVFSTLQKRKPTYKNYRTNG